MMTDGAPVIGVLGGGQLGRMMAEAAHRIGVNVAVLDPKGASSPAGLVTRLAYTGDYKDEKRVKQFVDESKCDVLTVEIEHVNADALKALEDMGVDVHPASQTIRLIQVREDERETRHHGYQPSSAMLTT